MWNLDIGIAEDLMKLEVEDARRQAKRARMLSLARGEHDQQAPSQGRWWVNQMGRQLSALGLRLEQYGQPHASR